MVPLSRIYPMPSPLTNRAFLSVAGEDVVHARNLASSFTPNLIYLYEQSGEMAANLWEEESAALRKASVVVIFWSKSYVKKRGTLREIRLMAELLEKRSLGHPLIVRLDDTDLGTLADFPGDPAHGIPVLAPLSQRWRALSLPYDPRLAEQTLERLLINNGTIAPPEFDRSTLVQELTKVGTISLREVKPVVWISGHEGYGRRFFIDRFMKTFDPNTRRREIGLSDADGPLQALLRVRSACFQATEAELSQLARQASAPYGGTAEVKLLTEAVQRLASMGQHLVFRLEPAHTDASGWIPKWIVDWFAELPIGSRPLVFVVAQFAYPAALLTGSPGGRKVAQLQVPSLTFEEATSYAARVTSIFDSVPERWTTADIEAIADAAEGTIALLIAIARERCHLFDLRLAPSPATVVEHAFTEKLTAHLNACVAQVRELPDALELLLALIDLVLISYDDLRTLFPKADLSNILGRCIEFGLVESPGDGLYQVPRLIQRRLYSRLTSSSNLTTEEISRSKRLLRLLAKTERFEDGGDVFQKIEARIRSSLAATGEAPDGRFAAFISSGYLMHSAIRAYERQSYEHALRLLRLCIRSQEDFPEINTRCVMLRYYGLAAARQEEDGDKLKAVELLRGIAKTPRLRGARMSPASDAEFILGFAARLSERWDEAIRHFRASLRLLEEEGNWRISDSHRELAECFLHTQPPDYAAARLHAEHAYKSRDNIMSLDISVKVLIQSCWNDTSLLNAEKVKLEERLDVLLARLESVSLALGIGTWHQRMAEDLAESREPDDLQSAVAHARKAIEKSRREDSHPLLWKLLLQLRTDESIAELIELVGRASANDRLNKRTRSVAARYLVAAYIAQGDFHLAQDVFNRFKTGFPRSIVEQLRDAISSGSLTGTDLSGNR